MSRRTVKTAGTLLLAWALWDVKDATWQTRLDEFPTQRACQAKVDALIRSARKHKIPEPVYACLPGHINLREFATAPQKNAR